MDSHNGVLLDMGSVLQSGSVTPGHLAKWATDGVIADNGPNAYSERVLASFLSADFNSTFDQPLPLPTSLSAFQLTGIVITNASISLTTAVGGFYPQASKGGTAIVAAGQVYSTLTTSLLLLNATLSSYAQAQRFSRTQLPDWAIYLALTTPQGAAATADVYIKGVELS